MSTTGKGLVKEEERMAEEKVNNIEELLLLPYLNEDIVEKIIIKIPGEALFNRLRYVCKPWYKLINNHPDIPLNRLLCSKPPCLILQTWDHSSHGYLNSDISDKEVCEIQDYPTYTTHFIKMGTEGTEEEFDLTPPFKELCIRACCNGIILASPGGIKRDPTMLHVFNPLTNQFFILPPYLDSDFCPPPQLIFLPSTREYKVIVGIHRGDETPKYYIQILTFSVGGRGSLGDLKWRLIESPNRLLRLAPLAINGIFYWVDCHMKEQIVLFDATAEKFLTTPHPFLEQEPRSSGGFIEMCGHLAYWCISRHSASPSLNNKLDVWILKDSYSGEWAKQYSVTIHSDFINPKYFYQKPVLSFGNGEVILFRDNMEKTLWTYNLKTNQWWNLRTNLIENDFIQFHGFHFDNILDLESIFATEQLDT